MQIDDLRRNAEKTKRKLGRPGVSVYAADGMTAHDLVSALGEQLPHPFVRISSAEAIREGGFELDPTLAAYHQTIWLPDSYSPDTLRALELLFQPPIHREDLAQTDNHTQG